MYGKKDILDEIFSFHLIKISPLKLPNFLFSSVKSPGLLHSERLLTMNLGAAMLAPSRFNVDVAAHFAWWKNEQALDTFFASEHGEKFANGWYVRMKLYRRWGQISEIKEAIVNKQLAETEKPVVAVTLARLKVGQARRFYTWGKPVETQVRDHPGKIMALAAFRPMHSFSTFTIWQNELEMINMVQGASERDGKSHKEAMGERLRKDFHREFTTMRFVPLQEITVWNG